LRCRRVAPIGYALTGYGSEEKNVHISLLDKPAYIVYNRRSENFEGVYKI